MKMLEKLLMLTGLTTPLCDTNEVQGWENRPFTSSWPGNQQKSTTQKGTEVKKTIKKRCKRHRTAFTTEQLQTLEKVFSSTKYIDREKRAQIAASLNMDDKCIKIWFQNRRMKEKRNSESSCDTSIESYSAAGSPPASVEMKPEVQIKQEDQVESPIIYTAQADTYNADQYHVPNYYYGNYHEYYGGPNNIPPNTTFYYDTNVYATQYYPTSGYYQENVQPQNWASDLNQNNYF